MSATAASNSPPAAGTVRADQLIDKQLSRVRRHIRIADLAAGGMLLLAGSLAYLLSMAVIDHWVYGLGYGGRLLALLGLLGGTAWYVGTRLVPTIWRPINPAFAAQTVERSEPALKNSLLNYLLLRRERAALHKVVLEALQYRAAVDLAQVEVDQTVDRTAMIRAGYVLVGVVIAAAAYKILSPKDPVQTVQRIVTPFADIARPARVSIEGIEPGDAEFYFGQTASVRAVVRGVRSDETVRLVYSTLDGQMVDRVVPMQLDANGLHHVADLPPQDGLRQDVRYRLEAGDGVSRDYQLRVIAAPVIAVETVEYDYPAYTRRPREVVKELGDIKAVEGTRVTVRARANQPIRSATIEFQADRDRAVPGGQPTPASEKLLMASDGTAAERAFPLRLSADGRTPRYEQYSLTFVNTAGVPSVAPVVHRIDVVPDLAPEVEILNPERSRVEVAWHGLLKIEVRAIDPDYGLNQVLVRAVQGGTHVFERAVLATSGQTGQVVGSIELRPADLGLEVGDEVTFWAVAEDNRMSPEKPAEPAPNTTRTGDFTFVVVADPARRPTGSPGEGAPKRGDGGSSKRAGRDEKSPPERPDPSSPAKEQPSPAGPDSAAKDPAADAKEPGAKDAQPGARSPEDGGGGEPGAEGGAPSQPGQEGSADQGSPGQGTSSGTRSGDPTGAPSIEKGNGAPESPDGGSPPSERSGSEGSDTAPGDQQAPAGGGAGQDPSGTGSGGGAGDEQRTGGTAGRQDGVPSDSEGQAGERSEPLHDGEVFEKALEHFRRKQQESGGAQPGQPSGDSAGSSQPEPRGGSGADSTPRPDAGARPQNAGPPTTPNPSQPTSPQAGSDASTPAPDATGNADPRGKPKMTPGKRQPDGNQGAGDQRNAETGEGGKSARGGLERPEADDKQPLRDAKSDQGQKQPGISDNGSSGDGEASRDTEGSGSVERFGRDPIRNVDTPKTGQPETNAPQDSSDPATTESQRQSDSKGGQSGDKSGGGKKGPGQGANQAGNDSAGQNSSSDDGAGQSTDSGPGDTASRRGQKQPSASPTGSTGDQAGPGSGNRPASPGQNASQPSGGSPPTGQQPPSATDGKTQQPGQGSGTPTGGGLPSNPPPSGATDTSSAAEAPPGDAANLEFSRRATDMVLEQLRDQQEHPDRELLDKLGWSPEQLRAFVERWQKLKQHAQEDAGGQRELDESLRGLGLAPSVDTRRRGGTRTDAVRGLQESGNQSAPPASYRDQFRAFKKGAARGDAP